MEVLGFLLVLFVLILLVPVIVGLTISVAMWMIDNAIRNTATFLDAFAEEAARPTAY